MNNLLRFTGVMLVSWLMQNTALASTPGVNNHLIEQGYFCANCNYQSAQEIARQQAAPTLHCKYTRTPTEDYVEQCNSLPKPYFVMNEQTGELWGFQVSHFPQGAARSHLQLRTSARNVDAALAEQLEILRKGKIEWPLAVTAVSDRFNQQFPTTTLAEHPIFPSGLLDAIWGKSFAASNHCQNNPHARALSNAFSLSYRDQLKTRVQAELDRQIAAGQFASMKAAFTQFRISGIQASGGLTASRQQPGLTISATVQFESRMESRFIEETYTSGSANSYISWQVSLDDSNRRLRIDLNQGGSEIDNLNLQQMLQNSLGSVKLDPCVITALRNSILDTHTPVQGSLLEQHRWLDNSQPTFGRLPSRYSDGGNDTGRVCRYTFSNPSTGFITVFLSRCP